MQGFRCERPATDLYGLAKRAKDCPIPLVLLQASTGALDLHAHWLVIRFHALPVAQDRFASVVRDQLRADDVGLG